MLIPGPGLPCRGEPRRTIDPDSIGTQPGDTVTVPDPIATSVTTAASRTGAIDAQSQSASSVLSSIFSARPSSAPPSGTAASIRILHVMGGAPIGSVTACDDVESCDVSVPRGGTIVLAATVDGVALSASQDIDAGATEAATLKLECTGSVTRGEVATCTASVDPASTSFTITGWTFTPSGAGLSEIVREGDAATTWSGTMATGGTVKVSATVAGATQEASAAIQVIPRSPATLAVDYKITRLDPGGLRIRPTSEHDFGETGFLPQVNANTVEYVTEGPNAGLQFFKAVPVTMEITVSVNTAALAVGSDFWRIQDPFGTHPVIGIGQCGRSDVTRVIPMVLAHEGPTRTSPDSHTKAFMDMFEPESQALFEPQVFSSSPAPLDDLVRLRNRAVQVTGAMVDKSLRNPFHLNCVFNYFPASQGH